MTGERLWTANIVVFFCFRLFEFIKFLQFHSVQRLHLQSKTAALLFINVAQQQLYS